MEKFGGCVVPALTALTPDETLDEDAEGRYIDFLVQAGVDGIFLLGSNGEGPMLERDVQRAVVSVASDAAAGRVPILAGAMEISTRRTTALIGALADLDVSGFVVSGPLFYQGFTTADMLRHFEHIRGATDKPVLLYHIPQATGSRVPPDAIRTLVDRGLIDGIKDSSREWPPFQDLLLHPPSPSFSLLQGEQSLAALSLLAGADGIVPRSASVLPKIFVDMVSAGRRGDIAAAMQLQAQADTAPTAALSTAKIHANKAYAKGAGLMGDTVCAPLGHVE